MEEEAAASPEPRTETEYEAAVNDLLAKLNRMNERAERDREESEQREDRSTTSRIDPELLLTRINYCNDTLSSLLEELDRERQLTRLRHDNLVLRLETTLLHFERRLLAGSPQDDQEVS